MVELFFKTKFIGVFSFFCNNEKKSTSFRKSSEGFFFSFPSSINSRVINQNVNNLNQFSAFHVPFYFAKNYTFLYVNTNT